MTQDEAFQFLNVSVDLLPSGSSNRPGTRIQPTYITIHNTSNDSPGANALMHARYMKGADARARQVSWHFTVDDVRCVKHLPTTEKAWHAGRGNSHSIGIEVCEHREIDHEAAIERASVLTAVMMLALQIPAQNVVTHKFWTGKDCPHIILRRSGGFEGFRERAAGVLAQLQASAASGGVQPFDVKDAETAAAGGGLVTLVDQFAAPGVRSFDLSEAGNDALYGKSDDRISELEQLVSRLALEQEKLRRVVMELRDNSFEAN